MNFSTWLEDPGWVDNTMARIQAQLEMQGYMSGITLESITKGPTHRAPRIVLLGVEKVGKSTFAAGADNPIFIPIAREEGIDDLDVASFPVANTLQDVKDSLRVLFEENHDYKTVVIDSSSALDPIITAQAVLDEGVESSAKLGGGYGRQYDTILLLWEELQGCMDALRNSKNMSCIMIGHVKVGSFDDPLVDSYSRYQWDIAKKVDAQLSRWADSILFANKPVIVKKEDGGFKTKSRGISAGRNVLFTQGMPGHPGGGRGVYGRLPVEIDLSWQAFKDAVINTAQNEKEF